MKGPLRNEYLVGSCRLRLRCDGAREELAFHAVRMGGYRQPMLVCPPCLAVHEATAAGDG